MCETIRRGWCYGSQRMCKFQTAEQDQVYQILLAVSHEDDSQGSIGVSDAEVIGRDGEIFHEGLLHNLGSLLKNTKVDVNLE